MLIGLLMLLFSQNSILTSLINLLLIFLSNGFKCSLCSLKLFNIINLFLGVYFFCCGFLFFMSSASDKIGGFINQNYKKIIVILLILLILFFWGNSFARVFDGDEGEHIHAGWHITQGETPYVDFFEHHHILLNYFIAITIKVFGENIGIFYIWRGIMFLLAMILLYFTYKLGERLFNKEVALISAIFLMTNFFFFMEIIKIRPDVPQVVFGLLSIYWFVKFSEEKTKKNILLSGIFAGISFLFLQKSVFLFASLLLILLYQSFIKKNVDKRYFFVFLLTFIIIVLPYYIYLSADRQLYDYFICNWLFNMRYTDHFSIIFTLVRWIIQNTFIWIFALAGTFYAFKTKKSSNKILIILFILLFASNLAVRVPFRQYFLIITPLMALLAGFGFYHFLRKQENIIKLILLMLIIAPVLVLMISESMITNSNFDDVQKIKFVIQKTNHDDYVYDGERYNFFRKDVDYISWNQGYGLETYQKIKPDYQYDIIKSIEKYKPKLIYSLGGQGVNLNNPFISENYVQTKYEEYLIRKD